MSVKIMLDYKLSKADDYSRTRRNSGGRLGFADRLPAWFYPFLHSPLKTVVLEILRAAVFIEFSQTLYNVSNLRCTAFYFSEGNFTNNRAKRQIRPKDFVLGGDYHGQDKQA